MTVVPVPRRVKRLWRCVFDTCAFFRFRTSVGIGIFRGSLQEADDQQPVFKNRYRYDGFAIVYVVSYSPVKSGGDLSRVPFACGERRVFFYNCFFFFFFILRALCTASRRAFLRVPLGSRCRKPSFAQSSRRRRSRRDDEPHAFVAPPPGAERAVYRVGGRQLICFPTMAACATIRLRDVQNGD